MDAEEAISSLGNWNRWQLCMYVLASVACCVMSAMQNLIVVFIGAEPPHHCAFPPGAYVNESIPQVTENGVLVYSKCTKYASWNDSEIDYNTTEDCGGQWHYDVDGGSTVVTEWNLVCKHNFLVELSQTILICGTAVGATIVSCLSDRFGRKGVLISSSFLLSLVGTCLAFTQSYVSFIVVRFLSGFLIQGAMLSGFVLACELFPARHRAVTALLLQCMWAVAMMYLAGLAYLIRDWRHLQLAVSVPGVLFLIYIWILEESIPWLTAKGRFSEAKAVLQRAAKFNKISLPEKFLPNNQIQNHDSDDSKPMIGQKSNDDSAHAIPRDGRASWIRRIIGCDSCKRHDVTNEGKDASTNVSLLDVLKSPKLRIYTLIMCYIWCCSALTYYGLSLTTSSLAGNPYLNFFLSGLVEIPSYVIAAILLKIWGRRNTVCMFYIVAGVALVTSPFIPANTGDGTDLSPLSTTLVMVGKFAITGAYGSIYLYAPEIFPTSTRNVGMGLSTVASGMGNILSPFSAYVAKAVPWIPGVVFGSMAILSGFFTLLLPETQGRPLPMTIAEVEQWPRSLTKDEKENLKTKRKQKDKQMIYTAQADQVDAL